VPCFCLLYLIRGQVATGSFSNISNLIQEASPDSSYMLVICSDDHERGSKNPSSQGLQVRRGLFLLSLAFDSRIQALGSSGLNYSMSVDGAILIVLEEGIQAGCRIEILF
jgi:hypothetical protein